MTEAEYLAATAPGSGEVVSYHDTRCAAAKTLGRDRCDCGALPVHLALVEAHRTLDRS